jgi:hypothetical protein
MSALACAGDSSAGPASAKAGSEALHQKMMQGAKDMQTMQMSGEPAPIPWTPQLSSTSALRRLRRRVPP